MLSCCIGDHEVMQTLWLMSYRDRELELWKARLDAKADAKLAKGERDGLGKGQLKQQGKVHAMTAWCHHPALLIR